MLKADADSLRPPVISEAALHEEILACRSRVRVLVRKILIKYPNEVDDVVQRTLYKACRAASTFRQGCKVSSWVYTIARNTALDFLRCEKNEPLSNSIELALSDDGELEFEIPTRTWGSIQDNPEQLHLEDEKKKQVRAAVELLSPLASRIVKCRLDLGLTLEEIAVVLDITLSKVKTTYCSCLIELRQILEKDSAMPQMTATAATRDSGFPENGKVLIVGFTQSANDIRFSTFRKRTSFVEPEAIVNKLSIRPTIQAVLVRIGLDESHKRRIRDCARAKGLQPDAIQHVHDLRDIDSFLKRHLNADKIDLTFDPDTVELPPLEQRPRTGPTPVATPPKVTVFPGDPKAYGNVTKAVAFYLDPTNNNLLNEARRISALLEQNHGYIVKPATLYRQVRKVAGNDGHTPYLKQTPGLTAVEDANSVPANVKSILDSAEERISQAHDSILDELKKLRAVCEQQQSRINRLTLESGSINRRANEAEAEIERLKKEIVPLRTAEKRLNNLLAAARED